MNNYNLTGPFITDVSNVCVYSEVGYANTLN